LTFHNAQASPRHSMARPHMATKHTRTDAVPRHSRTHIPRTTAMFGTAPPAFPAKSHPIFSPSAFHRWCARRRRARAAPVGSSRVCFQRTMRRAIRGALTNSPLHTLTSRTQWVRNPHMHPARRCGGCTRRHTNPVWTEPAQACLCLSSSDVLAAAGSSRHPGMVSPRRSTLDGRSV